jgi:hypothetical protein
MLEGIEIIVENNNFVVRVGAAGGLVSLFWRDGGR